MAFSTSALTAWNNEIADRSKIILTPILAATSMEYLEKFNGITGENVKLPTFDTTAPAQAGTACGFTTSGSTTLDQFTMTTVPIKVQESICLQDLETFFTKQWLPGISQPDTYQIVDMWVQEKLKQITRKIGRAH